MNKECKVKIGSAYEPKWFERRQTSGWYSAKNVPLDTDQIWLQNVLLGNKVQKQYKAKVVVTIASLLVVSYLMWVFK